MVDTNYSTYLEKGIGILSIEVDPLTETELEEVLKCGYLFRTYDEAKIRAEKLDKYLIQYLRRISKNEREC